MNALALGTLCLAVGMMAVHHDAGATKDTVHIAELQPVNVNASGTSAGGEARFTIRGDTLTIRVRVHGVPPNIEHWQDFHGFADGKQAQCSTAAADANRDGYIDIRETEPATGITMVPFSANPVSMNVNTNTYPRASAEGTYEYQTTVSLAALQEEFNRKYRGPIDLDRRVVQVHGVPASTALPATVASLDGIPARVTLPIACGAIRRVNQ